MDEITKTLHNMSEQLATAINDADGTFKGF